MGYVKSSIRKFGIRNKSGTIKSNKTAKRGIIVEKKRWNMEEAVGNISPDFIVDGWAVVAER